MYIKVLVTAGAKRESVTKEKENQWRISVREPAEQNLANARVRTLIAREVGVPLAQVRIIAGHHARSKMISVDITEL